MPGQQEKRNNQNRQRHQGRKNRQQDPGAAGKHQSDSSKQPQGAKPKQKPVDWVVNVLFRVNPSTFELEVLIEYDVEQKHWSFPNMKADKSSDGFMEFECGAMRILTERYGTFDLGNGNVTHLNDEIDGLETLRDASGDQIATFDGSPDRIRMLHFRHSIVPTWKTIEWQSWTPHPLPHYMYGHAPPFGTMTINGRVYEQAKLVHWIPVGELKLGYKDLQDKIVQTWYEMKAGCAEKGEQLAMAFYHARKPEGICRVTSQWGYNLDKVEEADSAAQNWIDADETGKKMFMNLSSVIHEFKAFDMPTRLQAIQHCFEPQMLEDAFNRIRDAGYDSFDKVASIPRSEKWLEENGLDKSLYAKNFNTFVDFFVSWDTPTQCECTQHCFRKHDLFRTFRLWGEHQELPYPPETLDVR